MLEPTVFAVFDGSGEVLGDLGGTVVFDLTRHEVHRGAPGCAHRGQLHMGDPAVTRHPGWERNTAEK